MLPFRLYQVEAMPLGARRLHVGCSGRDVLALQSELAAAGYLDETDGRYGLLTEDAVRRFQRRHGLRPDGVAGEKTIAAVRGLNEGTGYIIHRVRSDDTDASVAAALGVAVESFRRQNGLKPRTELPAGSTVYSSRRLLLLDGVGPRPANLRYSALLGPHLAWTEAGPTLSAGEGGDLPVLTLPEHGWERPGRMPEAWTDAINLLRNLRRESSCPSWIADLPASAWRRRRKLLRLLQDLAAGMGQKPWPLIHWPAPSDPSPDLTALNGYSDYLLLDPGSAAFSLCRLARMLRRWGEAVSPAKSIIMLEAGGMIRSAQGPTRFLPLGEAKAEARSAKIRPVWDEIEGVYRAVCRDGKEPCEIRLLEERGLKDRARLIQRFDWAGLALCGLAGVPLPKQDPWPGEFAVMDNFFPPRHIDY